MNPKNEKERDLEAAIAAQEEAKRKREEARAFSLMSRANMSDETKQRIDEENEMAYKRFMRSRERQQEKNDWVHIHAQEVLNRFGRDGVIQAVMFRDERTGSFELR